MKESLKFKIQELDFEESFKDVLGTNKIVHLSQLLEMSPEQIMEIPGLTFKHLQEYRQYLASNNLEYLQKDF